MIPNINKKAINELEKLKIRICRVRLVEISAELAKLEAEKNQIGKIINESKAKKRARK